MSGTIAGVMIACDGERESKAVRTTLFQPINLRLDHDIFTTGTVSPLSVYIGIPLVVLKSRPSLVPTRRGQGTSACYSSTDGAEYYKNAIAATLMLNAHQGTTPLLVTPPEWIEKVGTVIIARQDKEPLDTVHIEVLCRFFNHLQSITSVQDIVKQLTPQEFNSFYEKIVSGKRR